MYCRLAIRDIITALRQLGSDVDIPTHIKALESENWETQAVAAFVLDRVQEPTAYEPCVTLLTHENDYLRFIAVVFIAYSGRKSALQYLHTALTDRSPNVRMAALWGISYAFDLTVAKELKTCLGDEHSNIREYSLKVLRDFRTSDTKSIIAMLNGNNEKVRKEAVRVLENLEDEKSVPPLIQTSHRDPNSEVRQAATIALARFADETFIKPYLMYKVEAATAKSFARMGCTEMIPLIVTSAIVTTGRNEVAEYVFSLVHLDAETALDILSYYERQFRTESWVLRLKGFTLLKLGKTKTALQCFKTTLKMEPDNPIHRRNLALFYVEQSDLTQAADYLSEVIFDPTPGAYAFLAYAVVLWQRGEQKAALEQLAEAQRLYRDVTNIEDLRFNEFWGAKALATVEEMIVHSQS